MTYLLQQLANAVPIAALYAALAFGYALAFGVMRRADISYGAVYAFAGQVLLLFTQFGYNRLWLILPAALTLGVAAALAYAGGASMIIGRFVMRPLAGTAANALLVAALGVAIVLMETARLASDTHTLWLPPLLNEHVVFLADPEFPVILTRMQLIGTFSLCAMIGCGGYMLVFTSWGRIWRAVAQDPFAAALCGTNSARVFLYAYAIAGLVAAFCGIESTLYYGTMDFGAGLFFGLKILMVAAVGGYSQPLRSAAGAALLGLVETLWAAYASYLWRDAVIFSFLVLLLVISKRERIVP